MILYLVKSTICLALLLGVYRLFLEKEKMHRFNRFFLLFSLIFSFTIPLIPVGLPDSPLTGLINGSAPRKKLHLYLAHRKLQQLSFRQIRMNRRSQLLSCFSHLFSYQV